MPYPASYGIFRQLLLVSASQFTARKETPTHNQRYGGDVTWYVQLLGSFNERDLSFEYIPHLDIVQVPGHDCNFYNLRRRLQLSSPLSALP